MGPKVQKYPFLTVDEWSEACDSFVDACESSIGEHDGWTSISHHKASAAHYIRITRTVVRSTGGPPGGEDQSAEAISGSGVAFEESDEEVLAVRGEEQDKRENTLTVTYDMLLSPSYCVPVLHFTCRDTTGLPVTDPASIYANLVPLGLKNQIRDVGVVGGISMTDHPITGLPSFFIHPCNTADALKQVGANRPVLVSEYMFLWMGIIPVSVGLATPSCALTKLQKSSGNAQKLDMPKQKGVT